MLILTIGLVVAIEAAVATFARHLVALQMVREKACTRSFYVCTTRPRARSQHPTRSCVHCSAGRLATIHALTQSRMHNRMHACSPVPTCPSPYTYKGCFIDFWFCAGGGRRDKDSSGYRSMDRADRRDGGGGYRGRGGRYENTHACMHTHARAHFHAFPSVCFTNSAL